MVDSLLNNGYTIPDLMDFGVTTSLIGQTFAGGIIFYVQSDGTGLVAAPLDQSTGAVWGCSGTIISGTGGIAIGTGFQNTIAIDTVCSTPGIAADICANLSLNGFTDWFLPSQDEIDEMYIKIGQGAQAPNTNIGNFSDTPYWSSTAQDSGLNPGLFAYLKNFNGNNIDGGRNGSFYVRAIRAF